MRQGVARQIHEFQRVIKHRGVTAVRVNNREQFAQLGVEYLGFDHALTRIHPVDVTAHGVDFTIVNQVTVRVRTFPAWESVGRKA